MRGHEAAQGFRSRIGETETRYDGFIWLSGILGDVRRRGAVINSGLYFAFPYDTFRLGQFSLRFPLPDCLWMIDA